MAAIAGRTKRLKFGPSVLTLPFRSPVVLARGAMLMDAGVVADKFVQGSGRTLQIKELDKTRAVHLNPFR